MFSVDNFLSKIGIKYEQLEEEEKKTLIGWLNNVSQKQISVEEIKEYVRSMADSVAKELCEHNLSKKNDLFLKARLKNYLLLLDFLTVPEKAQASLERYLKNIKL